MYSIWIIPPEPVYSQLKSVVASLANKYSGPLFEPHITVLGNIEADLSDVETKVRSVLRRMEGLQLSLGPVSFSTTYFQSVFVRVNSTASLMQLNLDLKKAVGRQNDVFMPHISLLYGDHEMDIREKALRDIKLEPARFIVSKVTLVPANDDPSSWKHLSSIPFGK